MNIKKHLVVFVFAAAITLLTARFSLFLLAAANSGRILQIDPSTNHLTAGSFVIALLLILGPPALFIFLYKGLSRMYGDKPNWEKWFTKSFWSKK